MREEGQGRELQRMKASVLPAQAPDNIRKEHSNGNDTGCHDRSGPIR